MTVSVQPVAGVGLIAAGHGHDPDEVIAAVRSYLTGRAVEQGLSPLATRIKTAGQPGLVPWPMAEWWWRDDLGPCGPQFEGARPVTLVQVNYDDVDDAPACPAFADKDGGV